MRSDPKCSIASDFYCDWQSCCSPAICTLLIWKTWTDELLSFGELHLLYVCSWNTLYIKFYGLLVNISVSVTVLGHHHVWEMLLNVTESVTVLSCSLWVSVKHSDIFFLSGASTLPWHCFCLFSCRKKFLKWLSRGWMRCFGLKKRLTRRWAEFTLTSRQLRGFYFLIF